MRRYKGRPWIDYNVYILSNKWQKKRIEQISKNPKCYCCGTKKALTVHHRSYRKFGHEKMTDLVTLCWRCHKKVHNMIKANKDIKLNNAHKIYKKARKKGNN